MLQAILGFQPDAPRGKLYVDPFLPTWMPDLELVDLQVGNAKLDMRLWREGEVTRWEVTRGPKNMVEQRRFARMTELWPATNSETQKATTAA